MVESKWLKYLGYSLTEITSRNMTQLEVVCPEFTPLITGVPTTDVSMQHVELMNLATGAKYTKKVGTTNVIVAEYWGSIINQDVPDVVQGEQVMLLNQAGMDTFYWYPIGRDLYKRINEHIRFSCANKAGDPTAPLTDSNTYYAEIDTKYHKRVIISTSNSDGERYRYTFLIDSIANTVTLKDNIGNELLIESDTPRVRLKNSNASFLDLNAYTGTWFARDALTIITNTLTMNTTNTINNSATAITNSPVTTINSDVTTINSDVTTINGTTAINLIGDVFSLTTTSTRTTGVVITVAPSIMPNIVVNSASIKVLGTIMASHFVQG